MFGEQRSASSATFCGSGGILTIVEKENSNVRYYFDCDLGSDASGFGGHVARLESQQKLGLWPERRAGIDRGSPARIAADGTPMKT
jgi:hypothetical protein